MQRLLVVSITVCGLMIANPAASHAEAPKQLAASNQNQAFAQTQKSKPVRPRTADCKLASDGSLSGQLVGTDGKPIRDAQLVLAAKKKIVATAKSSQNGTFRFTKAPTGALGIYFGNESRLVRVWSAQTSPPSAKDKLLVVSGNVARAQCCDAGCAEGCDGTSCGGAGYQGHFGGVFQRLLHNPWLVGAGTAAAIAIPLATDDDDVREGDAS